jgi:hypothetical protein
MSVVGFMVSSLYAPGPAIAKTPLITQILAQWVRFDARRSADDGTFPHLPAATAVFGWLRLGSFRCVSLRGRRRQRDGGFVFPKLPST